MVGGCSRPVYNRSQTRVMPTAKGEDMIRVAINGFGRIGRSAFKIAQERQDVEIVAVNDLTDTATLAHLLQYDSTYGRYQATVTHDDQHLVVDGRPILVLAERDPARLPWADLAVDVVIESTGLFTDQAAASQHLTAGAKRVVISGPTKSDQIDMVVLGVNDQAIDTATPVVSNASCTTNSLGAVMAILEAEFGVRKSMLTTVHSYTASQRLLDAPAKDLREARSAAENIVPTSTGAARAVTRVLPSLAGKFDGISMRVPTPVVSISDVTALLGRSTTVEEVNAIFTAASQQARYQGVLGVNDQPLVSRDYLGDSRSGVVDLALTRVVDGDLVKVCVWYDNEWGYSHRLVELVARVGQALA